MTAQEIQKRNGRAHKLRVLQVDEDHFFVESEEGKICYKVTLSTDEMSCTCGDFSRGIKSDHAFRCKHIIAVLNCKTGDIRQAEFLEKGKPKLDDRFLKTVEGREFVLYAGLLDLAHQRGLLKIEVEPIQYPSKENGDFAICRAVATAMTGETFSDVGDANPQNCNSKVARHLLRMASTRAKARALRDMTNIGMTCLEELDLADNADTADNGSTQPKAEQKKAPARRTTSTSRSRSSSRNTPPSQSETGTESSALSAPSAEKTGKRVQTPTQTSNTHPDDNVPRMSAAQLRAIQNLARRRGISIEELEAMVQEAYQVQLESLSSKDASTFIRQLQTAA